MAQRGNDKRQFQFNRGLNTEAGYLTPVPGTWADGDNMIPQLNGEIHRRTRIDLEASAASYALSSFSTEQRQTLAHTVGIWKAVGGDGSRNFTVVQHGTKINFYENFGSVSPNQLSFDINLATYKAPNNPNIAGLAPITCASGLGRLFIASPDTDTILVTWSASGGGDGSITVERLRPQIRDFVGVDDGYTIDERRTTLDAAHHYNLRNQGWVEDKINKFKNGDSFVGITDTFFVPGWGSYPSNHDIQSDGDVTAQVTGFKWFSASAVVGGPNGLDAADAGPGNQPGRFPSKGSAVYSPFDANRGDVFGITLPQEFNEPYRASTVAFFAGRLWYGGMKSQEVGRWVLFSQVFLGGSDSTKFQSCFQEADPNTVEDSDIVDTDGGVVPLHDVGTILRLVPVGNSLIVFADNGVWSISGPEAGFTATSYTVTKLSAIGCVAARSVVEVEDMVLYWSNDGIYALTPADSLNQSFKIQSITEKTIQQFYNDIPQLAKVYVAGVLHPTLRTIYWAYSGEGAPSSTLNRFKKNKVLAFDLRLGAWYTMTFEDVDTGSPTDPHVIDLFVSEPSSSATTVTHLVLVGEDTVLTSDDESVIISASTVVGGTRTLKFWITTASSGGTVYSTCADLLAPLYLTGQRFRDWYEINDQGAHFDAFIETQWEEDGLGADKHMQSHYVTVFLKKTEQVVDIPPIIIET